MFQNPSDQDRTSGISTVKLFNTDDDGKIRNAPESKVSVDVMLDNLNNGGTWEAPL